MKRFFLCALTALPLSSVIAQNEMHSQLWGKDGASWSETSRLPDFSFAGYRSGEAPIPNAPVKASVRDFGAKGDGESDDTQAFLKAIEATENGALLIPAGRYKLTEIIYIRKPNLVFRGEGTDKTTLYFPKPLEQIKSNLGATTTGRPTSNYSWSGGLIWVQGQNTGTLLGSVAAPATRGSRIVELNAPARVAPGQRVIVEQEDPGDKSLLHYLYQGQTGDISKITTTRIAFFSKVVAVDGAKITLERALRTDVDPRWKARVRIYQPTVSEVGIENLTFEFPNTPYEGHFTEQGYNPLTFMNVADCWARNLRVLNADSGPFVSGYFITIQNVIYESQRKPDNAGNTGHHGITLGSDNLFRDFEFRTKFVHDLTVSAGGAGSVAMRGKGVDICFDHHKRFPHANLYTDIDLGAGTRMYRSGGGDALGRHTAAWTTFWNIRSARPQSWPPAAYGPDFLNLIGVETKDKATLDANGRWFEPIPPAQLQPQNLYEAQLARRLKAK
jgi:hypothetical protein